MHANQVAWVDRPQLTTAWGSLGEDEMYKHILISTDGSEVAQKGVDHGLSLAKSLKARVTIIMVTEGFPIYAHDGMTGAWVPGPAEMAQYEAGQKEIAQKVLAAVKPQQKSLVCRQTLSIFRKPIQPKQSSNWQGHVIAV
jgi:nucleotide-binding universal stress UspA family protein